MKLTVVKSVSKQPTATSWNVTPMSRWKHAGVKAPGSFAFLLVFSVASPANNEK